MQLTTNRCCSLLSRLLGRAQENEIIEINLIMSQEAPMRPALNSEAAHANHGHPILYLYYTVTSLLSIKQLSQQVAY